MCQFRSSPKEIEYCIENNVLFTFSIIFCVNIFFSIPVMPSLTFVLICVDFLVKFYFLKNLDNSNKQLYYVIACIILWKWVQVPPPLTWHICQIIVDSFGLVVFAYILNQFRGHWLLNNALNFAIHEFKIQSWNRFCNLWQFNGRR